MSLRRRAMQSDGQTPLVWVVEFYAPWCGFCLKNSAGYKLAAEKMDGEIEFGAVKLPVGETVILLHPPLHPY